MSVANRVWSAGVMAAVVLAAPAGAQDFEWSGRLGSGQAIEVKGVNGEIVAEPIDGDQVVVRASKHGRRSDPADVRIEVVEHDEGVTVCAVYPTPHDARRENRCAPGDRGGMNSEDNDVQVDFFVQVPAGRSLLARTVNGEIDARDLRSDVRAHTVNGDVRISTSGLGEAQTVNGSIEAELGRSDLSGDLDFETVNGSITVHVPDGLDADFHARTVNGGVETDFPILVRGRMDRRELRGTIGDGGRDLTFTTVNGSIHLRRR